MVRLCAVLIMQKKSIRPWSFDPHIEHQTKVGDAKMDILKMKASWDEDVEVEKKWS